MTFIDFICPTCSVKSKKYIGHYNRSKSIGAPVYCSRICAGVARQKTVEEKKKVKADYDKKISKTTERKEARSRYFQKSYKNNPEKYKEIRKKRYPKHLEYLNTPEYKEWKKEYDKKYLAKKDYGVFAEAKIMLSELENYLSQNMPSELKFQMGITNKTQKRKRLWQRTNKNFQQQT